MDILFSSVSQGFIWAIMAIGVYLTYRILDIADLTAEGSFPLGAAVCAALITINVHPLLAVLGGFGAGMIAGLCTGLLTTKLKIPALLSGILTMTALYSINMHVMGQGNLNLIGKETLVQWLAPLGLSNDMAMLVIGGVMIALVILVLFLFFNTGLGLAIRATGDNETMSKANGVRTDRMKIIGYMISNGLIALSGTLMAMNNGYADISMGIGTIVIGLAAVIIAEVIFHNLTFGMRLLTIVVGAIIYRLIMAIVFELGINPLDLKLATAILLTIALCSPLVSNKLKQLGKKKGAN